MTERWQWLATTYRTSSENGGSVTIEEAKDEGRAEVTFTAPAGWKLEKLDLDRCTFAWLGEPMVADGIVLARSPDGTWEAHVVECKRTVTDDKWSRVQKQLRGSCIRLLAAGGVVGLTVARITLYTAFRRDQLGRRSPDAVLLGPLAGLPFGPDAPAARRSAWQADELVVEGFGPLEHHRIQLTDSGDDVGRAAILLGRSS
jgi:hypothetical protein